MEIKKLTKLIKEIASIDAELARMQKMAVDLKAEQDRIVADGGFENEANLDKIVRVRTKLELIPGSQLGFGERRRVILQDELPAEVATRSRELCREVQVKIEAVKARIAKAVLPFCADTKEAEAAADQLASLVKSTAELINLDGSAGMCPIWGSDNDEERVHKAERLLDHWREFEQLAAK